MRELEKKLTIILLYEADFPLTYSVANCQERDEQNI